MNDLLTWQKQLEAEQHKAKKLLRDHSAWATKYLIPLFGPRSKDAEAMGTAAVQQSFHHRRYWEVEWRRRVLRKLNEMRGPMTPKRGAR